MFGNECIGLENEELVCCYVMVCIFSVEDFSLFNFF